MARFSYDKTKSVATGATGLPFSSTGVGFRADGIHSYDKDWFVRSVLKCWPALYHNNVIKRKPLL